MTKEDIRREPCGPRRGPQPTGGIRTYGRRCPRSGWSTCTRISAGFAAFPETEQPRIDRSSATSASACRTRWCPRWRPASLGPKKRAQRTSNGQNQALPALVGGGRRTRSGAGRPRLRRGDAFAWWTLSRAGRRGGDLPGSGDGSGPDGAVSATDVAAFGPVLEAFVAARPELHVTYEAWNTNDLYEAAAAACRRRHRRRPYRELRGRPAGEARQRRLRPTAPLAATAALSPEANWRDESSA